MLGADGPIIYLRDADGTVHLPGRPGMVPLMYRGWTLCGRVIVERTDWEVMIGIQMATNMVDCKPCLRGGT